MYKQFHLQIIIFRSGIYFFKSRDFQWEGEDLKSKTALMCSVATQYQLRVQRPQETVCFNLTLRNKDICILGKFYWQVISWTFLYLTEMFTIWNISNWTLLMSLNIAKTFTAYCTTWSIFKTCRILLAKCRKPLLLSEQNNVTHMW